MVRVILDRESVRRKDAAYLLGVSKNTLIAWEKAGILLPDYRIPGRGDRKYSIELLREFQRNHVKPKGRTAKPKPPKTVPSADFQDFKRRLEIVTGITPKAPDGPTGLERFPEKPIGGNSGYGG